MTKADVNSILSKRVEDCDLSIHLKNLLGMYGMETVSQIVSHTESDLMKHHKFGYKTISELKKYLSNNGLSIGMKKEELNPK